MDEKVDDLEIVQSINYVRCASVNVHPPDCFIDMNCTKVCSTPDVKLLVQLYLFSPSFLIYNKYLISFMCKHLRPEAGGENCFWK